MAEKTTEREKSTRFKLYTGSWRRRRGLCQRASPRPRLGARNGDQVFAGCLWRLAGKYPGLTKAVVAGFKVI